MHRYLVFVLLIAATGCAAQPQKRMQQLMEEETIATQKTFAMTLEEQKEVDAKKCPEGKHSVWVNTLDKAAIASITKLPVVICSLDAATLGETKPEEVGLVYGFQIEAGSDKEAQKLVDEFGKSGIEAQIRSGAEAPRG